MVELTKEAAREIKPGTTRTRIVDAATMLFWRQGYHPVSTDAICRAAGINKGSLYFVFPAKADILLACLQAVAETEWAEIEAIYAEPGLDLETRFRTHMEWFAESQRSLKARSGAVLGTFDMAMGVSIPEAVMETMRTYRERHLARLNQVVAELLGAGQSDGAAWLTDLIGQLVSGASIRARLGDDLAPLEELPATVFRLIALLRAAG